MSGMEPGLTAEERIEEFRAWQRSHPFGEQDEDGIDIGHLRANLRLTPAQRFEKHRRALELMLEAQRAAGSRLGIFAGSHEHP